MNIYLENGYIDMDKVMYNSNTFLIMIGARGIGKTYGILNYARKNNKRFVMVRRTQQEIDLISSDELNPFKIINQLEGSNIHLNKVSNKIKGFYNCDKNNKPIGKPIGIVIALSTAKKLRGFDASDYDMIIYDEFIPERMERDFFKGMEGEAFSNLYETINRNRELQGKEAVQAVLLSNSNKLDNDILIYLKLVNVIYKMQEKGQEYFSNDERCVTIYNLNSSPISEQKKETVLYKLTNDTEFSRMALENDFNIDNSNISWRPIKEYKLLCIFSEYGLYKHKSNSTYYITPLIVGSASQYDLTEKGKAAFVRKYSQVYYSYINDRVFFENFYCQSIFLRFYK